LSREKWRISKKALRAFVRCLLDKGAEAELTVSNRPASYAQVLIWAQQLDAERIWASKTAAGLGVVSPSIW